MYDIYQPTVEQAIAARPGFQGAVMFDEPTAAWGRSATAPRVSLFTEIEQAIAARPGFRNTTIFDEPIEAWGRSTTAPIPDAEAFTDGRFVERNS